MPEFLSAAWFAAIDGIEIGTDPSLSFELEQVVTGAPAGEVRYRATVRDGRLSVSPGAGARPPDATLRLSWSTAVALATGARTAHQAFRDGEVQFAGDLRRVQALTAAFGAISAAAAAIREATTYPVAG